MKIKFENVEELNVWFDHICTRCAFCNRDCGKGDPCSVCKANRAYEEKKDELEKGGNK